MKKSDFVLLDNSSKLIYDNSSIPINVVGLTNTNEINELYDTNYFTITLVHQPDMIKDIHNSNLVLDLRNKEEISKNKVKRLVL